MENNHQGNIRAKKATIYLTTEGISLGNVHKLEVREVEVIRKPWAQYPSAVQCKYLLPRKRNWSGRTGSYKPYIVVLEGWGHPDPDSPWVTIKEDSEVSVSESKYFSCSDGWETDFDRKLTSYLEANPSVKVLGDYRHTNGCNPHDPTPAKEHADHREQSMTRQFIERAGVDPETANKAAQLYVRHGAPHTAAFLSNAHDYMCTLHGPSALNFGYGVVIEPEPFFS